MFLDGKVTKNIGSIMANLHGMKKLQVLKNIADDVYENDFRR